MIYILLGILCSTCILVIFKAGDRFGANTRHIIVVGYPVSALAGALIFSVTPQNIISPWFIVAALEGVLFYSVFRLMAISAQNSGISITSIASKMSVVIPLAVGIAWLNETVNTTIVVGIICGLLAILLSVGKRGNISGWYWPLLVFIGTGVVDVSLKLFQVYGMTQADFPPFLVTVFSFAFVTGILHHLTYQERSINSRSILAGILLGLMNLGSTYFLMAALATPALSSVFVYSMNNFGILVLAMLLALAVFREPVDSKGWVGLGLAVASIGLLYWGHV